GEDRRRRDHRLARHRHGRGRSGRESEGARQLVRAAQHQDSRRRIVGGNSRAEGRAAQARARGRARGGPLVPPPETMRLRVLAIGAGLLLWFITQKMIGARNLPDGSLYDHFHVVTGGWNRWLHAHPRAANVVLVASSLCVDAVTLFVLARAVFGPSFTPFFG